MKYINLLESIKNVIGHSPARCGRVYFECNITRADDTLKIKFIPTTRYFETDERTDDEAKMHESFTYYESHHHTGMAIGSLECFLQNNNIPYKIDESNSPAYFEVLVNV
jgi:hypothetical protein